ncbi:MAG: WG repeat-containing protein [Flavobacterium sp.]|nr:WG repeat-containing protein [Flavobacterium sp.]
MKLTLYITLLILPFQQCIGQDLVPFRDNGLWGYKDQQQGLISILPQYDYASTFLYDIAIVGRNDKKGAINKQNVLLVPIEHEFLQLLDSSEFLYGRKAEYFGEYIVGVMTFDQEIKIPAEYNGIRKIKNTYLLTKNIDSIISYTNGEVIRSVSYLQGLNDLDGNVLIPCEYSNITWKNDTLIVVSRGKNQGLFNNKGKQLTGFEYVVFGDFIEGVAKARINNKFGFIYPTGEVAIPIQFEYCDNFRNGYAYIMQGNKWGLINKKGEIVIETKFEFEDLQIIVEKKYGR